MKISVVGAGRAATALTVRWRAAGHEIVAVSGSGRSEAARERARQHLPGVAFTDARDAARAGEVVVLGVPDDLIESTCEALGSGEHEAADGGWRKGQTVLHLSGATGLGVLVAAERAGAGVLSLHPLQTFPTVEAALERIPGSVMAVTARDAASQALGERLGRDAGGRPVLIAEEMKPLYHAAAVFASNYLVTVLAEAETLLRAAGVEDALEALLPLARTSFDNVEELGPAEALTGPAARGDAGTVARNLEALALHRPDAIASYRALARAAVHLAQHSGSLDASKAEAVEEVLARWN